MVPIIIAIAIAGYVGFIILKKIKAIKEGKFCSCGDCPSKRKCGENQK